MKQWEYRRHILVGAIIIIGVIVAIHFLSDYGDGATIDLFGAIGLPSGVAPEVDVSGAVGTFQQTATSPDGKYDYALDMDPLSGTIPNAAL